MKKAVSLALALVMCAAMAIPAFAETTVVFNGRAYDEDLLLYPIVQEAQMGVAGWNNTDASIVIGPAMGSTTPAAYYEVQWNDDLEGIAYAFYGTPSLANALYEANKGGHFLATGGILQANTALRIPNVLNGFARLADPHDVIPLRFGPTEVDDGICYPVRAGDTLAKIAAAYYDGRTDSFIISNIVARNPDLANANSIRVGQYLILPYINIGL